MISGYEIHFATLLYIFYSANQILLMGISKHSLQIQLVDVLKLVVLTCAVATCTFAELKLALKVQPNICFYAQEVDLMRPI